jgi:hypothetical protein
MIERRPKGRRFIQRKALRPALEAAVCFDTLRRVEMDSMLQNAARQASRENASVQNH